ncbi:MAG: site-specific DNA-methyltransferase [Desulfobacteraceae bacterium]|nr:site-specific DNA-methyltransferase [Desulfobacteraceae bacterium]MBC2755501.1 site-specific DNA-methyltransferase [Desulfobacteraceae bacterium]
MPLKLNQQIIWRCIDLHVLLEYRWTGSGIIINAIKKRNGSNELSIKLMDRIIEMASDEGDIVFDPFGGSGTTYAVSEIKNRQWVGIEIGPVDDIVNRFENIDDDDAYLNKIRKNINCLITKEGLKRRIENRWWTPDSVRKKIK